MNPAFARVLLLGETASGSSYLRWQLENRGCHCWFARSAAEAATLYQEHSFDLILSTTLLSKSDALIARLAHSGSRVFHCRPDDESCWWLPLETGGEASSGESGMRPSEFLDMLDRLLSQRRTRTFSAPQKYIPPYAERQAFKAAS